MSARANAKTLVKWHSVPQISAILLGTQSDAATTLSDAATTLIE
jgi:hypothetical protein